MKRIILISAVCLFFLAGCAAGGPVPSSASTDGAAQAAQNGFAFMDRSDQTGEVSEILTVEPTAEQFVPMEDKNETSALTLTGSMPVCQISVNYNIEPIEIYAEDGTLLMTGQNAEAVIKTADRSEINEWLDSLRQASTEQANQTVEDLLDTAKMAYESEDYPFYTYSYYDSMDVARIDSKIISLITHHSIFSGGAHPNGYWETANLDLDRMQKLSLSDIIEEGKDQLLLDCILEKVDTEYESMGEGSLYPDYREEVISHMEYAPDCWYFSEKGLCFFFNPYEIAPYAAGIIQITIPYSELSGILKQEYVPIQQKGETTLIILSENCPDAITVNPEETGKAMCIGAAEPVGTLRINRLIWIADMAIDSENIYTISNLLPNEVLRVIVAGDADQPQYQITVSDGIGGETNYYLSEHGLQQQK